jgi:hypothetical protein
MSTSGIRVHSVTATLACTMDLSIRSLLLQYLLSSFVVNFQVTFCSTLILCWQKVALSCLLLSCFGAKNESSNKIICRSKLFVYYFLRLLFHDTVISLLCPLCHFVLRLGVGSGCIDPRFLDLGTSWRWVFSVTPRPLYPQGKSLPIPIG